MVKYFGIFLSAIACVALGFTMAGDVRRRIIQLRSLQCALRMLKGEMEYAISSLEEAFERISIRLEPPFSIFFHAVSSELKELEEKNLSEIWTRQVKILAKNSCLKEEDFTLLDELGNQLGYLDIQMQIRTIDALYIQLEERLKQLSEESLISCKLYQSLGFLGALCVILVCI
jgi:stage III sporulation protein AB